MSLNILTLDLLTAAFKIRDGAHVLHLISKNAAEHKTLNDFYEAVTEHVDAICEIAIANGVNLAEWFHEREPNVEIAATLSTVLSTKNTKMLVRHYANLLTAYQTAVNTNPSPNFKNAAAALSPVIDDAVVASNKIMFKLGLT